MLRFRRYRVFVVFAIFTVAALYHFTSIRNLEDATAASVEGLKKYGLKDKTPTTTQAAPPVQTQIQRTKSAPILLTTLQVTQEAVSQPLIATEDSTLNTKVKVPTTSALSTAPTTASVEETGIEISPEVTNPPAKASLPKVAPDIKDTLPGQGGQGRLEVGPLPTGQPITHWSRHTEHFPLPSESIIQLPSGTPVSIPKIQHNFKDESPSARIDREKKRTTIKETFQHAWKGYKEHAWLQDELRPVSGKSRNPFCGWAATLVDALDTLWIMGMEDDFKQAASAVGNIDFTTSIRHDIPLFETTIRYLGGLLSAYDLSGGKYKVLLDKAVELAEILMGAFDTPNRMPVTYYKWQPEFASQPQRARIRVVLAEIGSLSVEFTRLAQITKEPKYYDAVARITNEFEIWQNNTKIPGLWPLAVDASGCKKPERVYATPVEVNDPDLVTVLRPAAADGSLAQATASSHQYSSDGAKVIGNKNGPVIPVTEEPFYKTDVQSSDAALKSDESVKGTSRKTESIKAESKHLTPTVEDRRFESKSQQWDGGIDSDEVEKTPTRKQASPADDSQTNSDLTKRQLVMEKIGTASSLPGSLSKAGNSSILLGSSGPDYIAPAPESEAKGQKKGIVSQTRPEEEASCAPQGLASPPGVMKEIFGFGGEADSIYEYLPKQYLLLGGLKSQYRTMYERAVEAANKYLLFRPMVPDARDILVLGTASLVEKPDVPGNLSLYPEQQHLLCFAGGMYAMGSRIFDRKADLDIAAKLTDGCVWAYGSTITGIMPEGFTMMPCDNKDTCEWNQTRWNDSLDPNLAYREQSLRSTQQALLRAQQQQRQQQQEQQPSPTQSPVERESEADGDLAETQVKTGVESDPILPISGPLTKRQLEFVHNDPPATGENTTLASNELPNSSHPPAGNANSTIVQGSRSETQEDTTAPFSTLAPSPTRDEFVEGKTKELRLPIGVTSITSRKYILRPEAIESVFIMYRVTGDESWREKGWKMFQAIRRYTTTEYGNSALRDVTMAEPPLLDEMESFWLSETLKYFYLLFSDPELISLDEYVLNTEAHPFRRPGVPRPK